MWCSLSTLLFSGYYLTVSVVGRSGATSCIGDNVTYTCSVPSLLHTWNIPSEKLSQNNISTQQSTYSDSRFTITLIAGDAGSITSLLWLAAINGWNGTLIQCADGDADLSRQMAVFCEYMD